MGVTSFNLKSITFLTKDTKIILFLGEHWYNIKVKLETVVEGDQKANFSIATNTKV